MDELFPTAKALLAWMVGVIGTLGGLLALVVNALFRNYLKAHYVTKEDLEKLCSDMSTSRERMHQENTGRFEALREDICNLQNESNRRLDALMQAQMRPYR